MGQYFGLQTKPYILPLPAPCENDLYANILYSHAHFRR